MIDFTQTVFLPRPIEEVFAFLSDFENLPDWDPGIQESKALQSGALQKGNEFAIVATFLGNRVPMKYILEEYVPLQSVTYRGFAESVEAVDRMEFRSEGGGTVVVYSANFVFRGSLALFSGPLSWAIRALGKKALEGMEKALSLPIPVTKVSWKTSLGDFAILPGMLSFGKGGYQSRKKNWTAITDSLEGKTIVITGAGSGIGFASAEAFAKRKANLVLVGSNRAKLEKAKEILEQQFGGIKVGLDVADLSLLSETRALAQRLQKAYPQIDVLVNNAGALYNQYTTTSEGFEKSFALLALSPYLLTRLLLPSLENAKNPRVVFVSSGGMYTQSLEARQILQKEAYNGSVAYALAKRGLVVLAELFGQKFPNSKVRFHSMHPGWVDTEAVRESLPGFYAITKKILRTPKEGADTIVWLASCEDANLTQGEFWLDREIHPKEIFPFTKSSQAEKERYWDWVTGLVGDFR